jgi:hypothetical protein
VLFRTLLAYTQLGVRLGRLPVVTLAAVEQIDDEVIDHVLV